MGQNPQPSYGPREGAGWPGDHGSAHRPLQQQGPPRQRRPCLGRDTRLHPKLLHPNNCTPKCCTPSCCTQTAAPQTTAPRLRHPKPLQAHGVPGPEPAQQRQLLPAHPGQAAMPGREKVSKSSRFMRTPPKCHSKAVQASSRLRPARLRTSAQALTRLLKGNFQLERPQKSHFRFLLGHSNASPATLVPRYPFSKAWALEL